MELIIQFILQQRTKVIRVWNRMTLNKRWWFLFGVDLFRIVIGTDGAYTVKKIFLCEVNISKKPQCNLLEKVSSDKNLKN